SCRGRSRDRGPRASACGPSQATAGAHAGALRDLLDSDQLRDLVDHAAQLRTLLVLDYLMPAALGDRLHGPLLLGLLPDPTARIAPPERMPVPGAAGLRRTFAAPFLRRISCGIVVPTIGTVTRCFLADSTALRMASGTSPALPRPAPTRPFWSPTTTSALNEKRRPPLTTFATRFRWTTFSVNSDWPLPYW